MSAKRIDNALDMIVSRSKGTEIEDEARSEYPIGVQIPNGRMTSALDRFVAEARQAAKKRGTDTDAEEDGHGYGNEEVSRDIYQSHQGIC
jgi:hypothetical protein